VTKKKFLCRADLDPFVLDLLNSGIRVVAPVRRKEQGREWVEYRQVQNSDEIILEGLLPVRSLKEVVFPRTENLFKWRQTNSRIEIEGRQDEFEETVVIGANPCDAAALEIIDRVMGWDYRDGAWFGRRQATTILSIACNQCDESCFCTAVGLSPDGMRGADWFLTPAEGGFNIEIRTPKGQQLLNRHEKRFPESAAESRTNVAGKAKVEENLILQPEAVQRWLGNNFESIIWKEIALHCIGCGVCTYVCPSCHCFDIVDEPEGTDHGFRRRHWDACQFSRFTLHASGYNPRRDQVARLRQRIMHKFSIYPDRFGEILCTGCGRCIRACAVGVDMISILWEISRRAEGIGTEP
jgi:ferredoxin